jgi:methylmalonyl-CoA epimerase
MHHVAYRVRDVAAALDALRDDGVRLVDETPRPGSRGTLIAFVHPKSMGGVLVELVQER